MSETPRTDEFAETLIPTTPTGPDYTQALHNWFNFARQLERELNEANRLVTVYKNDSMLLQEQRDQWKAMAQELADCLNDLLHHGCPIPHPLTGEPEPYQSKPHVAEETLSRFNKLNKNTP